MGGGVNRPTMVVHADWSTDFKKRWMVRAAVDGQIYRVEAPEPVGDVSTLWTRTVSLADPGAVVMGFDFPIGLPATFAIQAGLTDFVSALPELGCGRWERFFDIAERADQVSVTRPFYPQRCVRKGDATRAHLTQGLRVNSMADLLRQCERAQPNRSAACSLFWTLGGNQVGRAAISGWRDFLRPLLRTPDHRVGIWPFDGDFSSLIGTRRCVIVETYPADACVQVGIGTPGRGWSKTKQGDRKDKALSLVQWAAARPIALSAQLEAAICDGFGSGADGEDRFDATVGMFGMLAVISGERSDRVPNDDRVRTVEGWIFGQQEKA